MPDFMQKCGVICTTLLSSKRKYLLRCEFCDCFFSQLDNFILHIEYKHQSNINSSGLMEGENSHAEDSSPNVDSTKDISHREWSYNYIDEAIDDTECETHNISKSADIVEETISEIITDDVSLLDEKFETCESENRIYTYGHFVDINIEYVNNYNYENNSQECKKETLQAKKDRKFKNGNCLKLGGSYDNSTEEHNLLKRYGKDTLLTILSVCEKHPVLWDKTTPYANDTWFREKAYKSIAEVAGKSIEWKVIRDIIQRLRIRILNQMRKKQLAEINDEAYTPLWENDIVAFLKPTRKKRDSKTQEKNLNRIVKKPSISIKNEATLAKENASKSISDYEPQAIMNNSNDDNAGESDYEGTETESDFEYPISPMALYDKETLMAIFSSYTYQGILWDENDPLYKNKKMRQKAYMSIASEVGKLSEWRTILKIIQRYRIRLQKELKKKKLATLDNEPFIPSWEQDMTSFLTLKTNTYVPIRRTLKLPDSKLSDLQCLKFIEIYKSFQCLWDEQDVTYRFNNRRREALVSIQELLKSKLGVSLTQTELESEIVRIRKICSQEKYYRLTCEHSNLVYKPDCAFYDKIAFLEVDVGPFQCSVCGDFVKGLTQYKIHKSTHDGSKPFSCVICQKGYNTIGNLAVHLRRHVRDYEFECNICKKRFATSTDLKGHERGHTGEKPYFCDICGQSFKSSSIFVTHSKRHQNIRSHKCDVCSKKFFSRSMLMNHIGTHLTVRNQICNVCGKGFKIKKHLRQHKQIHESKKKYVCKICGKQFAQCAGLTAHMKTHGTTLVSKLPKVIDVNIGTSE